MVTSKINYRPRRDFKGMENRRIQAAQLFKLGKKQAEVAKALGVSRQSVSRWYSRFKRGGVKRLQGAGRAGRKPRLNSSQLVRVDKTLRHGARDNGFQSNLWTLPRIAIVIERLTGIKYHPGHVWRILQQLEWTLQRPAKRAKERNEEAVKQWISKRWPAIKKKPENYSAGSFSKMKVVSRKDLQFVEHGHPRAKHRS